MLFKKKLINYIIYLSILLIIFTFFAEIIILPLFLKIPSRSMFLVGFIAPPNTVIDDTKINSMGYTGDVINTEKPQNSIRILTLGGSAFFNRRMADKLKKSLQKKSDKKIELLGGALRVHSTKSSIIKFKYLSKYKFDYVLIYHGINDLDANHIIKNDFKSDYSHINPWYKRNLLLDNSIICRIIYNKFIYKNTKLKYMASPYISEPIFKENLITLINSIKESGAKPILMTFAYSIPSNYSFNNFKLNKVGYNNSEKYDRCPVEMWGNPKYVDTAIRHNNNIIHSIKEKYNVMFIDQHDLMGKDLHWYGDLCHFSKEGTDKFIQNIVDYFNENKLIKNLNSASKN